MSPALLLPAGALLGAAGYRLRGSALWHAWTGMGDTEARLLAFALPCTLLALAAGLPHGWAPVLLLAALWLGESFPLFRAIDLGRGEGSFVGDALKLLARGVLGVLPACAVLFWAGGAWGWFLAAGAAMPLAYIAGWAIPSRLPNLARGPEIGEALWGAALGAGLVATVLA